MVGKTNLPEYRGARLLGKLIYDTRSRLPFCPIFRPDDVGEGSRVCWARKKTAR
ncbi:hypothetical protein FTUN_6959 [Frigoriglobus tundricola]|uniref:Uncharacterized protein n=1 Tax=Frigoriglobus tundricola TaxID=2774151 RepID=A0A6M5Z1Q0_9BACT|nr:hypothetical protein FTUN_6959 [Frigoriglobus tundricola]